MKIIIFALLTLMLTGCYTSKPDISSAQVVYIYDDLYTPHYNVTYIYSNKLSQWGYYDNRSVWCPAPSSTYINKLEAKRQRMTTRSPHAGTARRSVTPKPRPHTRTVLKSPAKATKSSTRKKSNVKQ